MWPLSLLLQSLLVNALPKRWADPEVTLPYGTYRGYYNESNGLDVWRSIRFGADTSGANRWRPPQPPVNQSGQVIDAKEWPLQCPASVAGDNQTPASYNPLQPIDGEDCLFLTVAAPPNAQNLPVAVWIFGGGLLFNSMQEFDPQPVVNFANNSIVGVAIQYRPGLFGFLNNPALGDGMNAGLKDCVAALEWVQQYIHLFGGDPNQVTIGGESAGGGLVLNLLAAQGVPGRQQLFQNAFVDSPGMPPQSACDTGIWKVEWDQITSILGCANDDADCVRNSDTRKLRILNNDYSDVETWIRGNAQAYSPCIEGDGGYVVEQALASFLNGQAQNNTVLLSGNNFGDGYGRPPTSVNPSNTSTTFQADADALFIDYMNHRWPVKDNDTESNQKLLDLYPLSDFPTNLDRTGQAVTDVQYACPSQYAATCMNGTGYKFLYAVPPGEHAQDNYQESPWFYYEKYGSTNSPSFFRSFLGSYISLVKTRNPNGLPGVRPADDPEWPTWDASGHQFKIFNVSTANISDSYIADESNQWAYRIGTPERCEFWAQLRVRDSW